uniref:SCRp n=1 Tax=Arabidopsis lyrata TaxID=59689 RepID=A0A068CLV1_ARALY|nr:SCRp [Arabidopsis lyrata]
MKSTTLVMVAYAIMFTFFSCHVKDLEAVNSDCIRTRNLRGPCPSGDGDSFCRAVFNYQVKNCRCLPHWDRQVCYCRIC